MRHRYKKTLDLVVGVKAPKVAMTELLTNLVTSGKVITTEKKAFILKSHADSFFSRLVQTYTAQEDEKNSRRVCAGIIKAAVYGDIAGKKVLDEILPKYLKTKKVSGFVADYKVGFRKGDGSLKVLVALE